MSYRGPRSIVTVDMSVDSRSTDGRDLGRATVATRSIIGDDSVDVVPVWRSSYRPRWLSAHIDSNTPTLHRHIIDTSSIFHRLPADISVNILSICFIDTYLDRHSCTYPTDLSVVISVDGQ